MAQHPENVGLARRELEAIQGAIAGPRSQLGISEGVPQRRTPSDGAAVAAAAGERSTSTSAEALRTNAAAARQQAGGGAASAPTATYGPGNLPAVVVDGDLEPEPEPDPDPAGCVTLAVGRNAVKQDLAHVHAPVDLQLWVQRVRGRTRRTGKWFAVHRVLAPSVEHDAECDISGRSFCVGTLEQRDRSGAVRGVAAAPGEEEQFRIPGNCAWFLQHLKDRQLIGWIDWVAGIGVNVPVSEVIDYMGGLYAKFAISGEWLYDLDALAAALRRGWIIQEQAFGPLDPHGATQLLALLRTSGVAFLGATGPQVAEAADALGRGCAAVSALLLRRGYSTGGSSQTELDKIRLPLFSQRDRRFYQDHYNGKHGFLFAGCAQLVAQRHSQCSPMLESQLFDLLWANDNEMASVHMLDVSTMPEAEYEQHLTELHAWLVTPSYAELSSEMFKQKFCATLLRGYCQAELTKEPDRDSAVTSVARHLLNVEFRESCDNAEQLMRCMWKVQCRELASESSTGLFQIPAFNQAMLGGFGPLGLGKVCGSRLHWQGQQVCYQVAQMGPSHENEVQVMPLSFDEMVHLIQPVDAAFASRSDRGVVDSHGRGPVDLYLCDTELGPQFVLFVAVPAKAMGATSLRPLGLTLMYTSELARPRADVVFQ